MFDRRWFSVILCGAMLSGCGGSTSLSSQLTFQVPAPGSYPAGTVDYKVNVYDTAGKLVGATVVGVSAKDTVLSRLPAGDVDVIVIAENSAKVPLASGRSTVSLTQGLTIPVNVGLSPVPAPVAVQSYVLAGTVSAASSGTARINLNAVVDPSTNEAVTGLTASRFSVLEDGVLTSPITVSHTRNVSGAKVDICFVCDTTETTDLALRGIEASITSFADTLVAADKDIRFAGVEFGDEVRSKFDFTSSTPEFLNWVHGLVAFGGGDDKDNPLDAVRASLSLNWRPDAQRVIVVITDSETHSADDGSNVTTETMESIGTALKGSYVLNTVCPNPPSPPARSPHVKLPLVAQIGAKTGGKFFLLPADGHVDLTELQIPELILSGYVVEFPSTLRTPARSHSVRLVLSDGSNPIADQRFSGKY